MNKIKANYIISCDEMFHQREFEREFDVENQSYGRVGFMVTADIMPLVGLSFTVKVEIVSIEYWADGDGFTIGDPFGIQELLCSF